MPWPSSRCQMRLTSVRGSRPLRGSVKIAAAAARRSASDAGRRRAAQLGVEERRLGVLVLRDVAAKQLQPRLGREVRRERVGVLQLPLADEAVVAGVALEVDAEKHLRGVLRRLHPRRDRGARLAAPVHADEEALGIAGVGRVEQLRDELVVGQVRRQRGEQPVGDALAAGASPRSSVTPSSLRSRSFQNEIQCSAYFSLSASSVRDQRVRACPALRSATNACSSSGVGSSPQTSR